MCHIIMLQVEYEILGYFSCHTTDTLRLYIANNVNNYM